MKILQISNKSPWPPAEGGPIAMNALIMGLQHEGHEIHVLTMSTDKFPVQEDKLPATYRESTRFRSVYVDTKVRMGAAFKNLFTSKSYNIERFISTDFEKQLRSCLKEQAYDAVLLESLFVTPYVALIRSHSRARIILRAHNIEHRIWERLTKATRNPLTKMYLALLTRRMLRYEKSVLPKVDGIAAITEKDAAFFRQHAPGVRVDTVPFGIIPEYYIYTPQNAQKISLCHIGSMNWMPNREGIRWFLEKCWPGIQNVFPKLELKLAGRNMPASITRHKLPGVEIVGEVADAAAFITNHPVMVVPLLSGSGVRVKIIEAMALGRTIITTSTGAEGICYTNGENILIADTPVEFFEHIRHCISHPEVSAKIGENARKLIETRHNNLIATRAMLKLLQSA